MVAWGLIKDLFIVDATVSAAKKSCHHRYQSAIELATTSSYVLDRMNMPLLLSYMYTGSTPMKPH